MSAAQEQPEKQLFAEALGDGPGRGRLAGRRILVVGAGQRITDNGTNLMGNGRGISRVFGREGAHVACADVNSSAAAAIAKEIMDAGGKATPIVADVEIPEDITRMVSEAVEAMGGLDGIVLNVGISGTPAGLAGQTVERWDRAFAINVRSHMLTCQAAFPVLEPGSSIIFISSAAAVRPGGNKPDYDTSKAALGGLMRHVAMEGEPKGIRANVLLLGMVDTPMGAVASAANPNRSKRWIPFGRQATAWETGNTALFLMSHDASYVNGHILVMDGGRTTIRNT
jgi:NAD(P)-dependent dehydrogenase (short-subunit alcohol dehydrogenase family)